MSVTEKIAAFAEFLAQLILSIKKIVDALKGLSGEDEEKPAE